MGDLLNCERESGNPNDLYEVAIKNGASVIGHASRKLSATFSLFLCLGGTAIKCKNTESSLIFCRFSTSVLESTEVTELSPKLKQRHAV